MRVLTSHKYKTGIFYSNVVPYTSQTVEISGHSNQHVVMTHSKYNIFKKEVQLLHATF